MESTPIFQCEPNLKRFGMISIATRLWENKDIRNKMQPEHFAVQEYAVNHERLRYSKQQESKLLKFKGENLYVLTKFVFSHLDLLPLSVVMLRKLKIVITYVGEKIYNFFFHVINEYGVDLFALRGAKIYWTCHGNIDEKKTLSFVWLNSGNHNLNKISDSRCYSSYNLACIFGDRSFAESHLTEMLKEVKTLWPDLYHDINADAVMLFYIFNTKLIFPYRYRPKQGFLLHHAKSPCELFCQYALGGFIKAAEHYCGRLDFKEHCGCVDDVSMKIVALRNDHVDFFIREKYCEILVQLINEMPESKKKKFIIKYVKEIIKLFIPIWPYNEYLLEIFDLPLNSNLNYQKLISTIVASIGRMEIYLPECPDKKNICHEVLERVWDAMTESQKNSCFYDRKFLLSLGSDFDYNSLKIMLDYALENRLHYIDHDVYESIEELFQVLACNRKFEVIDQLNTGFKHQLLYKTSKILDKFFEFPDDLKIVLKFLDWICNSEGDKLVVKDSLNYVKYCRQLLELEKFDVAEQLLKWLFETENKIDAAKTEIRSDNFLLMKLYDKWRKECELMTQRHDDCTNLRAQCAGLFNFFIKIEEDNRKLEKELDFTENNNFFEFFFRKAFEDCKSRFDIDNFFSLCFVSSESKEKAKKKLRENINNYLDPFVYKLDFRSAELLIFWICDNHEVEIRKLIKNYLNVPKSVKAAVLFEILVKERHNRFPSTYLASKLSFFSKLFHLSSWLLCTDELEKMKSDLLVLKDNTADPFLFYLEQLNETNHVLIAIERTMDLYVGKGSYKILDIGLFNFYDPEK